MIRKMKYPLTQDCLEQEIRYRIESNPHFKGRNAAYRHLRFFLKFRVVGVHDAQPDEAIVILTRLTKLDMECVLHGQRFVASPKQLLNISYMRDKATCPHCERDAGVGRKFTALGEAQQMIFDTEEFDWTLDVDRLEESVYDPNRPVRTTECLPLRCKRRKLGSDELCNATVMHRWGNIQHTLRALSKQPNVLGQKKHICCQGPCDSKKKGKAIRSSVEELVNNLLRHRGDAWTITNPQRFRKMSEPLWFTHTCGNEVFRMPEKIVNYGKGNDLQVDQSGDCPYCKQNSPLRCLNGSVLHYEKWVAVVTEGTILFKGRSLPKSADHLLELQCACGASYKADQWSLQNNVHYGCPSCQRTALSALRAWQLEDGRAIVARRGMTLLDNPMSYTEPAHIIDSKGCRTPYASILALVRSLPATAKGYGYGSICRVPLTAINTGLPYSAADIAFIEEHQSTMSYRKLAAVLGRTDTSVKQQFRRLGIRNDQREHYKRTIEVWDRAFSVTTPESSYWAGLLASDGCISDRGLVRIELKALDEDVLQALACYLKFTGKFSYRSVRNVNGRGMYASFSFRSNQIRKDLEQKFGIVQRKTDSLPPPDIVDSLLCRAYIVGLIEGDGHIHRSRRGGLMLNFISASPNLFSWVAEQVSAILGKTFSTSHTGKTKRVSSIVVWHNDAERLKLILLEAFEGKMARKWSI